MKKITLTVMAVIITVLFSYAQVPQAFKYQAVARNTLGDVLENQNVSFRISILQGSTTGTVVYSELHDVITNSFGLVNLEIGKGIILSGLFTSIDWGSDTFFLYLQIDSGEGSGYQHMGTTQLLSVPYAMDAQHAHSLTLTDKKGNKYALTVDSLGNLVTRELTWNKCGDLLTDNRDGKEYGTVLIGVQCWMSDNLNIGTLISDDIEQSNQSPSIIEKYCYDNDPSQCDTYGGLYQWGELMQYENINGAQGICPEGWHIPTDFEFKVLEWNLDGEIGIGHSTWNTSGWRGLLAGRMLKSTNSWFEDGNGTDDFEFNALPGGGLFGEGFDGLQKETVFRTSTGNLPTNSWIRYLKHDHTDIYRGPLGNNRGLSVRCIKDYDNDAPETPNEITPMNGATNADVTVDLSWSCSDTNGDTIFYNVYFGNTNPPILVSSSDTSSLFDPGVLDFNTTYYWKIVAYDGYGDSTSGDLWSFDTSLEWLCGQTLVDDRDGQYYSTVEIGSQCWMSENLNIGEMLNTDYGLFPEDNGEIEKLCYNNMMLFCSIWGGLYNWDEMMNYITTESTQGICPESWHIPSADEWCSLTQSIDAEIDCTVPEIGINVGLKLKSTAGWAYEGNGTNEYGFNAKPAGYISYDGNQFYENAIEEESVFYSSTEYSSSDVFTRWLWAWSDLLELSTIEKTSFNSVRCIKD